MTHGSASAHEESVLPVYSFHWTMLTALSTSQAQLYVPWTDDRMRNRLMAEVLRPILFWRSLALLRPEGCMLMVGAKVVDIAGQLSLILTHSSLFYGLSMLGPDML